jgi:hypothetical protein
MTQNTAPILLNGVLNLIKKSRFPLAPVYEAITNSMEAISLRKFPNKAKKEIEIEFYYSTLFEGIRKIDRIIVTDNGVGFDNTNFKRFNPLLDRTKGYNNRGSGRIQFLHRCKRVEIDSIYVDKEVSHRRVFSLDSTWEELVIKAFKAPASIDIAHRKANDGGLF